MYVALGPRSEHGMLQYDNTRIIVLVIAAVSASMDGQYCRIRYSHLKKNEVH